MKAETVTEKSTIREKPMLTKAKLHTGYEEIWTVKNAPGVTQRRKSFPAGTAPEKQQTS